MGEYRNVLYVFRFVTNAQFYYDKCLVDVKEWRRALRVWVYSNALNVEGYEEPASGGDPSDDKDNAKKIKSGDGLLGGKLETLFVVEFGVERVGSFPFRNMESGLKMIHNSFFRFSMNICDKMFIVVVFTCPQCVIYGHNISIKVRFVEKFVFFWSLLVMNLFLHEAIYF